MKYKRIFFSQEKAARYELNEQGAIKGTDLSYNDSGELGYPDEWGSDDHVWLDAAQELESLSGAFGDCLEVEGYDSAQIYLGDMQYIIENKQTE